MSRFFGFVFAACLLAFATSISVPAASPDWPKSLTLATAAPGGVYYVYGEAVAKLLTESLKIDVNPLPTQGGLDLVNDAARSRRIFAKFAAVHMSASGTTRKRLAARIDSANWGEADRN